MSWCSDAPEDEAISLFAGLLANPDVRLSPRLPHQERMIRPCVEQPSRYPVRGDAGCGSPDFWRARRFMYSLQYSFISYNNNNNKNIYETPIVSRSYTLPSHSQTSRLFSSSLSRDLGLSFPRVTQCVRGF
jgi:hypothetical protein